MTIYHAYQALKYVGRMMEDALSILAYSDYSLKRMDNWEDEKRFLIHKEDIFCFDAHLGIEYVCRFLHTCTFLGIYNYKCSNSLNFFWRENSNVELFLFYIFKVKIFAYLSKFIFKVINFLRFNEKFPWTPSFIFSFVFSKPLRIKPQHSITYVQSRINEGFCVTVTRLTCDEMCDTFEAFDC